MNSGGGGGSGGATGSTGFISAGFIHGNGYGGAYGGGGGGGSGDGLQAGGNGANGAVRIIWGQGRSFPSNAA